MQRWMNLGACRAEEDSTPTTAGDIFFDEDADPARAIGICLGCSVRETCLTYAITEGEDYGIWGAMTPTERKAEKQRQQKRATA